MSRVCPSWLSFILHNPVRKRFTDRTIILDESCISSDSVVLEIGAGNGFFTEIIAEHAKKVICVELQDGMVKKLKKRVKGFENVEIVTADIATYSASDASIDVCLLYYSFHEVRNKADAVTNISNAVKPYGILSIYEPTLEVGKAKMKETIAMFQSSRFNVEAERNGLFTRFARLRKSGKEL